jgi:hypothetical protein
MALVAKNLATKTMGILPNPSPSFSQGPVLGGSYFRSWKWQKHLVMD